MRSFLFERTELENNVFLYWKKNKTDYYANLNKEDIAGNKQFWRKVKPLHSGKTKCSEKITLVEEETVINKDVSSLIFLLLSKAKKVRS